MLVKLKQITRRALRSVDLDLIRYANKQKLSSDALELDAVYNRIEFLAHINKESAIELLSYLAKSRSQLGQDLFVLLELGFKRDGYFVEFGATNGIDLSNSLLLEQEFDWNGILAEPARCWHDALRQNRRCHIETGCVWRVSGSNITFSEVESGGLSTIDSFASEDFYRERRKGAIKYDVKTISLLDMLDKYNAPRNIDYLSIDTEGSEYDILSGFDFGKYNVSLITCEHNFQPNRKKKSRVAQTARIRAQARESVGRRRLVCEMTGGFRRNRVCAA